MIRVNVKLYAALRNHFPDYDPNNGIDVEMNEGSTSEDLIRILGLLQTEAGVIIVNGISKRMTERMNDRDQVSIFTPISGG